MSTSATLTIACVHVRPSRRASVRRTVMHVEAVVIVVHGMLRAAVDLTYRRVIVI